MNHPWRRTVTAISKSTISLLSKVHSLPLSVDVCASVSMFFLYVFLVCLSVCVCSSQIT